jgi:hypothetical protein
MNSSSNYIIRIYRFEKDKPRSLVGLVEEVGKKGKKAFNTYDELWEILNSPEQDLRRLKIKSDRC